MAKEDGKGAENEGLGCECRTYFLERVCKEALGLEDPASLLDDALVVRPLASRSRMASFIHRLSSPSLSMTTPLPLLAHCVCSLCRSMW